MFGVSFASKERDPAIRLPEARLDPYAFAAQDRLDAETGAPDKPHLFDHNHREFEPLVVTIAGDATARKRRGTA